MYMYIIPYSLCWLKPYNSPNRTAPVARPKSNSPKGAELPCESKSWPILGATRRGGFPSGKLV